jgi:hypothetical protein
VFRITIAQRQHLEPLRLQRAVQWDTARPTIGSTANIIGRDGQGAGRRCVPRIEATSPGHRGFDIF